jgi:Ser/Thr protein kinase RdoA (MazF antagonist)
MKKILENWGLSEESVELIQTSLHNSTWNIGGKYILQQHSGSNKEHMHRMVHLANMLIAQGIPAIEFIKTDNEYSLTKKIEGEHIDFYASPDTATELGRGLAQLHNALTEIKCDNNDFLREWKNYIKPGLVCVSQEIIEQTELKLVNLYEKLPRCPIHRDVHSNNILFRNGKISGWLDFELNRKDARVFDLAYFLAGLLVGKIENPRMIETWKTIYRNVLAGYSEVSPLSPEEIEILPFLLIAIELLFVTYWNSLENSAERDKAIELAQYLSSISIHF